MHPLFTPIKLGSIHAPNRILMAPLTRARATRDHVPTTLMRDYYVQRASAGLIISEATGISREGLGWPYAPGLWSEDQVEGWKWITEGVHDAGGRIIAQLWHMGRLVHPSFLDGQKPVSASATTAPYKAHTYEGRRPYAQARPLQIDEIGRVIADYAKAADNALRAGFDGVQVHAANGYLIDQFLRNSANFREDGYGGPVENRIRLLREVTSAVADRIGADRTAVRLSPNGDSQGVDDSDPYRLFTTAAAALDDLEIAFLELREPGYEGTFGKASVDPVHPLIRKAFKGPLVLNSDHDEQSARAAIDNGSADAISFGRTFLANPDLPARLAIGARLNPDDRQTWYSQDSRGYIDYPTLESDSRPA